MIKAATTEEEQQEEISDLENHLEKAKLAREHYKIVNINKAKLHNQSDFLCLSFDWGQNWEIPRFTKHPGELYFLSRQRVGLFGVTNEKTDHQTFYCVPEKELSCLGKGPNVVLSFLYDYLMKLEVMPSKLVLYFDNCAAQNKNNYLLWFSHWLCSVCPALREVELNSLLPGHTKFSPDRHFGYAKKTYNATDNIETFPDVLEVIKQSSDTQSVFGIRDFATNNLNLKFYNWKSFLSQRYRKAPARLKVFTSHFFKIKKNSHKIEYRLYHDSEPMYFTTTNHNFDMEGEPELLVPDSEPNSSRIEDLEKVERFIALDKREKFWRGIR